MSHITKQEVYSFWQQHPLGSYEIKAQKGTRAYFEELDKIRSASSRFALPLYRFDDCRGKKVLDVGCGPGWISFHYARGGAELTSVDLTPAAIEMTKKHLALYGLSTHAMVADAENLPFDDGVFDFVCCDGVLHHTPNTAQGMREIWRVLKPGGRALISLYYKNWLLKGFMFSLTRWAMRRLGVRTPHGLDVASDARMTLNEFGRTYDGKDNPLGRIFSGAEARRLLRESGFLILKAEVHYFPVRFVKQLRALPRGIEHFFDRTCGTMIYFIGEK